MLKAISSWMIETGLSFLPGKISRRLYLPQKVAAQINIDLRGNEPIVISLGSEISTMSLWLKISNLSPFHLVLDRMLIDFRVSQPILYGLMLNRYDIPKKGHCEVFFRDVLSGAQQLQIRKHINQNNLIPEIRISVNAYFDSDIGQIFVHKDDLRLDNIFCKLSSG
jgi:hypothetical protein